MARLPYRNSKPDVTQSVKITKLCEHYRSTHMNLKVSSYFIFQVIFPVNLILDKRIYDYHSKPERVSATGHNPRSILLDTF